MNESKSCLHAASVVIIGLGKLQRTHYSSWLSQVLFINGIISGCLSMCVLAFI